MREEGGGCVDGGRRSCAPGDEQREERTRVTGGRGSGRGAGKERLRSEQEREREQAAGDKRVRARLEPTTEAEGWARELRAEKERERKQAA